MLAPPHRFLLSSRRKGGSSLQEDDCSVEPRDYESRAHLRDRVGCLCNFPFPHASPVDSMPVSCLVEKDLVPNQSNHHHDLLPRIPAERLSQARSYEPFLGISRAASLLHHG